MSEQFITQYNNIRQLLPSYRLTNIIKASGLHDVSSMPDVAHSLFAMFSKHVYVLFSNNGYYLGTSADLQTPYTVLSSTQSSPSPYGNIKYNLYVLCEEVYSALVQLHLSSCATKMPFINSYITEYYCNPSSTSDENINELITHVPQSYNINNELNLIKRIHATSSQTLSFPIPTDVNKVSYADGKVSFETESGNNTSHPCNVATYDVVVSKLILQGHNLYAFNSSKRSEYYSLYNSW